MGEVPGNSGVSLSSDALRFSPLCSLLQVKKNDFGLLLLLIFLCNCSLMSVGLVMSAFIRK
jgi:hypothetical protein